MDNKTDNLNDFMMNNDALVVATFIIINNILAEANVIYIDDDGQSRLLQLCHAIKNNDLTLIDGIGELKRYFDELNLENIAKLRNYFVRIERLIASTIERMDDIDDENGDIK